MSVSFVKKDWLAHLSLPAARINTLVKGISGHSAVFAAKMQNRFGKLNSAQTAVMGRIELIALRPLRDPEQGGEGILDPRSGWALTRRA